MKAGASTATGGAKYVDASAGANTPQKGGQDVARLGMGMKRLGLGVVGAGAGVAAGAITAKAA